MILTVGMNRSGSVAVRGTTVTQNAEPLLVLSARTPVILHPCFERIQAGDLLDDRFE